jgi:hypothetical protein
MSIPFIKIFLPGQPLGACFISRVVRFAPSYFAHFAGFEGEYLLYLTEKRVKWAEKGGVKDGGGTYETGS